ncbi:uncharacterized protein PAC_04532 [Phialocephala subalpina]|uniref:Uncharacterized protein n=1 Tax=Phialocephala subalpina TaxID=576137 RepID=A0A1L7WPF2_9HELO|nr:uncharacterized protein PAC_04532 [Phialocephala subalpina]
MSTANSSTNGANASSAATKELATSTNPAAIAAAFTPVESVKLPAAALVPYTSVWDQMEPIIKAKNHAEAIRLSRDDASIVADIEAEVATESDKEIRYIIKIVTYSHHKFMTMDLRIASYEMAIWGKLKLGDEFYPHRRFPGDTTALSVFLNWSAKRTKVELAVQAAAEEARAAPLRKALEEKLAGKKMVEETTEQSPMASKGKGVDLEVAKEPETLPPRSPTINRKVSTGKGDEAVVVDMEKKIISDEKNVIEGTVSEEKGVEELEGSALKAKNKEEERPDSEENIPETLPPRSPILDRDKAYEERYADGEDEEADGGVPLFWK